MSVVIEPRERSDDADSILNRVSLTGEEESIDSGDYEVMMATRTKRLMNIQILWMFMMVVTFLLMCLQIVLFLGSKK